MFPLSITQYVQFGICAVAILFSAYLGYSYEHRRFMAFKQEIEAIAKAQEAKVESIQKQQALVTKGIENEYNAKLALLRQYYANGVHNSSSGKLPTISNAATGLDAITAYNLLVGQCAEASQQLVSLQSWLNEQIGIK
jgi:outer membrane usher protein FimD/PapC